MGTGGYRKRNSNLVGKLYLRRIFGCMDEPQREGNLGGLDVGENMVVIKSTPPHFTGEKTRWRE